jgi:hypothetical protein
MRRRIEFIVPSVAGGGLARGDSVRCFLRAGEDSASTSIFTSSNKERITGPGSTISSNVDEATFARA